MIPDPSKLCFLRNGYRGVFYLRVPKMGTKVITLVTKLQRYNLVHAGLKWPEIDSLITSGQSRSAEN
jgi:hypothetical protein